MNLSGRIIDLYFKLPSNFYDTAGAYGMLCSASLVLQTAKKNNYNRILLLEDDIIFHNNFNKLFERNISKVPNDWYLLYFGTSMHNWRLKNRGIYHKHYFHKLFNRKIMICECLDRLSLQECHQDRV